MLEMIAAVSLNGGIGKDGKLPWHIPEELQLFKNLTMGKSIIMGRKTWDSLGHRPLPGRVNIVVSRTHSPTFDVDPADGVIFVDSVEAALSACDNEGVIIGGERIYRRMLPLVDMLHLSTVNLNITDADAHFPDVNWEEWDQIGGQLKQHFTYNCYCRKTVPQRTEGEIQAILVTLKESLGDGSDFS